MISRVVSLHTHLENIPPTLSYEYSLPYQILTLLITPQTHDDNRLYFLSLVLTLDIMDT